MERQAALVARARGGDPRAFEELVRPLWQRAYHLALHFVCDPGLAEDVAQEALTRAWLHLGQLRDGAAFPPWLLRIVANQARNALGRARETPVAEFAHDMPDTDPGPGASLVQHEQRVRLEAALATLRPPERLAVELVLRDELAYREAAGILGIPTGSVKTLVHRGRAKLKKALDEDRPGLEGGALHVLGDVR